MASWEEESTEAFEDPEEIEENRVLGLGALSGLFSGGQPSTPGASKAPTFDDLHGIWQGPPSMSRTRSDASSAAGFGQRRSLDENLQEAIKRTFAEQFEFHMGRLMVQTRAGHEGLRAQLEAVKNQLERVESQMSLGGISGRRGQDNADHQDIEGTLDKFREELLRELSAFVHPAPVMGHVASQRMARTQLPLPLLQQREKEHEREKSMSPLGDDAMSASIHSKMSIPSPPMVKTKTSSQRHVDVFDLDTMRTEMVFQHSGLTDQYTPSSLPARHSNISHTPSSVPSSSSRPGGSFVAAALSARQIAAGGGSPLGTAALARRAAVEAFTSLAPAMSPRSSDGHRVSFSLTMGRRSSEPPNNLDTPPMLHRIEGSIHSELDGQQEVDAEVTSEAGSCRRSPRNNSNGREKRLNRSVTSRTVDLLRTEHEARILSDNVVSFLDEYGSLSDPEATFLFRLPQAVLISCGAVCYDEDRRSMWYVVFVLLIIALLLVHSLLTAALQPKALYMHLVTACHALGCLLGLVLLHVWRIDKLLGPESRPLHNFARGAGFVELWAQASARRLIFVLVLWGLMCGCRIAQFQLPECFIDIDGSGVAMVHSITSLVNFSVISGFFALLVFLQLHICCGLELAVDSFCFRFVQGMGYDQAVLQWGVVQALLRGAARTIDSSFVALCTTILATLVLTGVRVLQVAFDNQGEALGSDGHCMALWSGWLVAPVVMLLYTTFRAAAVTEKCLRVPPFVNLWAMEDQPIDLDRQYAAQHILQSEAGFYIKGVRLNGAMALKLAYLFGVVIFTFATKTLLAV